MTVTATQGTNTSRTSFRWVVTPTNPLVAVADQVSPVNQVIQPLLIGPPTASDTTAVVAPGFSVTVGNLPAGLTFNRADGTIEGTPATATVSPTLVTVRFTNTGTAAVLYTQTFYWTVQNPTGARITGPSVVPGNSVYTYTINYGRVLGDDEDGTLSFDYSQNPAGNYDNSVKIITDSSAIQGNQTVQTVSLQFWNDAPVKVIVSASILDQIVATLPIDLVQVIVEPGAFAANGVTQAFNGFGTAANNVAISGVESGDPTHSAVDWSAYVILNGPNGNQGVSQIQVGFIQHITVVSLYGIYNGDNGQLDPSLRLLASTMNNTYLDEASDRRAAASPWYYTLGDGTFVGSGGNNQTVMTGLDVPVPGVAVNYSRQTLAQINETLAILAPVNGGDASALGLLGQYYAQLSFNLDVAAQTLDTTGGANTSYFAEAGETWSWNGNGTMAYTTRNGTLQVPTWTALNGGGVTNPGDAWTGVTSPTLERINGPIYNTILGNVTFSPPA